MHEEFSLSFRATSFSLCWFQCLSAQSLNTSQISGVVQDATGAVIPKAKVTLTQIGHRHRTHGDYQ